METHIDSKPRTSSFWGRIAAAWQTITQLHPSIQDPEEQRLSRLLAGLSLIIGIMGGVLLFSTAAFIRPEDAKNIDFQTLVVGVGMLLIVYGVNRTGRYRISTWIFIVSLFSVFISVPFLHGAVPYILAYVVIIPILAGIFFDFRTVMLISVAVSVLTWIQIQLFSRTYAYPYQPIEDTYPYIVIWQFIIFCNVVVVSFIYYVKVLESRRITAIESTNEQLRASEIELETRVADRTRDVLLTLEVGQFSTTIYDQAELLPRVTEFIRAQFDLYYTQVYLVDEAQRYAVLEAGTGEAGQLLLSRHHRLDLSATSIVARAVKTQQSMLVADTMTSDIHLPNPLLQETRSEVAIPLIVGDQVLGVLDMQAREAETFSEDNLPVFEAMANQLAAALRSVQAHAGTQAAVERADMATRRLTGEAWAGYLDRLSQDKHVGYQYDLQEVRPLTGPLSHDDASDNDLGKQIARSVTLRGQPIGTIQLNEDAERTWTEDELALVDNVAERVALAVDQFRAFDETQKRAAEMQTVAEVGAEASTALEVDQLLWMTSDLVKERFGLYHAHIYLLDKAGDDLVLAAGAGDAGKSMVSAGHHIAASHKRSLVARAARTRTGVVVNDVTQAPDFLPNPLLPDIRSEMAIPMIVGDQVLGVLDVQSDVPNYFTEQDLSVQSTLASQIAVAVNNANLFELVQRRAAEMQTVAEVGAEASTALEVDQLLWMTSDLVKERFGLYHAHIYLLDEAGDDLILAAGAGDAGKSMVSAGHHIAVSHERSLVARAARTRAGVVVNDVTQAPDFLPNPLLPDTRSEMAIPMIVGDQAVGVLDVQSDVLNYFTEQDTTIQTTLASQIAVSIQNAQLYTEQLEITEQLREVDRLKSEFLASMSHELRTPLNSIIGYAEVLLDGIDGELNEDMEEDVDAIHGSGKHLLNLINNILDLAKIEAGQMDLVRDEFELEPLAREIINMQRVLLKGKPVELIFDMSDDLPPIYGDSLRINQVISNLFTNAIKFTEQGSITLRAHPYELDARMVHIQMIDTGIGMMPEQLSLIFDRFRQVDQSHTRRAGGTGLGLSISRQLINMHEGEIWVESEYGVGSTFQFTLPLVLDESRKA